MSSTDYNIKTDYDLTLQAILSMELGQCPLYLSPFSDRKSDYLFLLFSSPCVLHNKSYYDSLLDSVTRHCFNLQLRLG